MKEIKICVVGLGYVGLPLARLFSTKFPTVGYDLNQKRVDALMAGHDATLEVKDELLQDAIKNHGFVCTTDLEKIKDCNFYVVAVPTPVDENKAPDLRPLWGASETVGKVISKGDIVDFHLERTSMLLLRKVYAPFAVSRGCCGIGLSTECNLHGLICICCSPDRNNLVTLKHHS